MDKYIRASEATKETKETPEKIILSDDAYAICELLTELIPKV